MESRRGWSCVFQTFGSSFSLLPMTKTRLANLKYDYHFFPQNNFNKRGCKSTHTNTALSNLNEEKSLERNLRFKITNKITI